MRTITGHQVRQLLRDGGELGLLDVREQGVHYQGHPFFAANLPLSRLELMVDALLPRKAAQLVLLDSGHEGLAERAAERLAQLGYQNITILEGGCEGWVAGGGELFAGMNVPSKAFGEFVEHRYETPRIEPDELQRLRASGAPIVILDSRPLEEYRLMNIPGSIDVPGAELVYRARALIDDPDTLVVVNCAGRTRSIIGCQSLRNAGLANKVVALKDGTMGWDLAGLDCERAASRIAPPPEGDALNWARHAAAQVAKRFEVHFASPDKLRVWQSDPERTIHLLDVRTAEEFATAHVTGSRHAPGGQLVQSTDEYVAIRGARIVLIDPGQVRAIMTASWLNQMGMRDVYVLEAQGADGWADLPIETGPPVLASLASKPMPQITVDELESVRSEPGVVLIDFNSSLQFRKGHVPGAWWAVRARMAEAKAAIGTAERIIVTANEAALADLAAVDVKAHWPNAQVQVLIDGTAAWSASGLALESGFERATSTPDDIWYKPYEQGENYAVAAREYLEWEVNLPKQVERDATIQFRRFD